MRSKVVFCALFIVACGGGSAKSNGPDGGSQFGIDVLTTGLPPSSITACQQASPKSCVGDIVGTWKYIGICNPGMTQQKIISEYERNGPCGTSADMKMGGAIKFRADGTYQNDERDDFIIYYPETCLKDRGLTCKDIVEELCATDGKQCTCTYTPVNGGMTGMYTTNGSRYHAVDYASGGSVDRDYCVQGDTLTIFSPPDTVFGGGVIVMTRVPDSYVIDIDAGPSPYVRYDAATDTSPRDAGRDVSIDKPGIADASADKPKTDVAPTDVSLVSVSTMVPGMAAICQTTPPAAAPCGGNIAGSWNILGVCDPWLTESEFLAQQKKSCSTWVEYGDTGTAVFGTDGSCVIDEKITYTTDYAVTCMASSNDTCSAKDQRIKKEIGTKDISAASCNLSSVSACSCSNTFDALPTGDACTYAVSGNELTFVSTPATFGADPYDYCVQGDRLTIFFSSWSADAAAAGEMATLVMTRISAVDAGIDAR